VVRSGQGRVVVESAIGVKESFKDVSFSFSLVRMILSWNRALYQAPDQASDDELVNWFVFLVLQDVSTSSIK